LPNFASSAFAARARCHAPVATLFDGAQIVRVDALVAFDELLPFFLGELAYTRNAGEDKAVAAKTEVRRSFTYVPRPSIDAPTATTDATPMMTPSRVRNDRNLCDQIESTAITSASHSAALDVELSGARPLRDELRRGLRSFYS